MYYYECEIVILLDDFSYNLNNKLFIFLFVYNNV